ncbi:hypothetical protein [Sinorhizobium fredii]|uniref:hypothetical protein n=1 Tax=Rhizobium fredii TaxID=380 RepID=UPI0018F828EA|nr:hypothetical protein [Sinorhizobium fredii]
MTSSHVICLHEICSERSVASAWNDIGVMWVFQESRLKGQVYYSYLLGNEAVRKPVDLEAAISHFLGVAYSTPSARLRAVGVMRPLNCSPSIFLQVPLSDGNLLLLDRTAEKYRWRARDFGRLPTRWRSNPPI